MPLPRFFKKSEPPARYYGALDALTLSAARGWAIDAQSLPRPAKIAVLVHGGVVATGDASGSRPDVKEHGFPSAECGFDIALNLRPEDLLSGAVSVTFWELDGAGPSLYLGEVLSGFPIDDRKPSRITKEDLFHQLADQIYAGREALYRRIASDPEFFALGGLVYPYDTLSANAKVMFDLLRASGFLDDFNSGEIQSVCDVGCANGEIALCFALLGLDVTAIDYSYKHDRAPFIVDRAARELGVSPCICDMSVDGDFTIDDIERSRISSPTTRVADGKFDLVVCFGLLYHLKNPFAFLGSLSKISRKVILGTHLFSHLPDQDGDLASRPLAYLVDADELNGDPTNFWIFTEPAFHRLVRRSGFDIMASTTIANHPSGVGLPNRPDFGIRGFVALRSCG